MNGMKTEKNTFTCVGEIATAAAVARDGGEKKYLLELLRELLELDQRWSLTVFGVGCGG